ncbi:MAG: PASTA domain-containing protein [Ruminococcus sp.]|nr:PASTA domain-containing protein [Ruminococcus sp.]
MKKMDTDKLRQSAEQIHLTDDQKTRIVENCMKHAGKSPDTGQVTESRHIFEVERVQSHPIRRVIAGIAACAVLAGGIGVTSHLITRSGIPGGATEPATEMTEPVQNVVPFGDISAFCFLGDANDNSDIPSEGLRFTEEQAARLNEFFASQTWKLIHTYNTGDEGFDPNFDGALLGDSAPPAEEYCYYFRSYDENNWYGDISFSSERYLEYRRPDPDNNSEIVEIYPIDAVAFREAVDAVLEGREMTETAESATAETLQLAQVPDVVGRNVDDAICLLGYKDFKVKTVYVAGEEKDIVMSSDKEAGSNYPVGTLITLYVANGTDTEEDHGYPFPSFTDFSYLETVCFYDFPDAEKSAALDELFRSLTWTEKYSREYRTENEFEEALNSSYWGDPNSFVNGDVTTYCFKTENKELGTTLVSVSPNDGGGVTVADKDGLHIYETDFDKLVGGIGEILFGEGLYGEDAPFGNYSGEWLNGNAPKMDYKFTSTSPEATAVVDMMKWMYWPTAEDGYKGTDEHLGFDWFALWYTVGDTSYELRVYDNDYAEWTAAASISDHDGAIENGTDTRTTGLRVKSDNLMHCFCLMTGTEVYPPFGSLYKIGSVTVNGSRNVTDYDTLHRLTQAFYGYNWNDPDTTSVPREEPVYRFATNINDTVRHILIYNDGTVSWFDKDGSWTPEELDGRAETYWQIGEKTDLCGTIREILG